MNSGLKRKAQSFASTDEDVESTQHHSKKSRLDDTSDDQSTAQDSDGSDMDDNDEEAELQMDIQNYEMERSQRQQAGVAEAGTVAQIELINFMCHKFLKMKFGPKINFVIGHNGSGKSAVLTGLLIALGAKANVTNRGKKLSSVIREGASAALVTVHLTNRGSDAFKHEVFGDYVIIERRLLKDGTGGFKIKTAQGKTISTKREDLVEILDYMCIQIDNPFTMLNQDMARQFLSNSSSNDKYNLFLRGTLLANLANDFAKIRETLDVTDESIKRKQAFLPALHRKAKEAMMRFEQLSESGKYEDALEILNNELVWSQVIAKERRLEEAQSSVSACEEKIASIEREIDRANNKTAHFGEELTQIKHAKQRYRDGNQPDQDAQQAQEDKVGNIKSNMDKIDGDMKLLNTRFKTAKAALAEQDTKIREKKQRLATDNQAKVDAINRDVERMEQDMAECQQLISAKEHEKAAVQDTIKKRRTELQDIKEEIQTATKERDDLRNDLRQLTAQKQDRLNAFGNGMGDLLRDIRGRQWTGRHPVGPFGLHVKLKHPEYSDVLEIILGGQLSNFAVENFDDQAVLKVLVDRYRVPRVNILVARQDIFDITDQPDDQHLTILRALDFSDEYVKRQLIISNRIHQIVLMDNRSRADEFMATNPKNVSGCFTAQCHRIGSKAGHRTESLRKSRGPSRFSQDVDGEIRRLQSKLREWDDKLKELQTKAAQSDRALQDLFNDARSIESQIREHDRRHHDLSNRIARLKEKLQEEEPDDLNILETERQEYDRELKQCQGMFRSLREQLGQEAEDLKREEATLAEFSTTAVTYNERIRQFDAEAMGVIDLIQKTNSDITRLGSDKITQTSRLEAQAANRDRLQKTVQDWTAEAMGDYPMRVETDRPQDVIQRDIKHMQQKIDAARAEVGMDIDTAQELASKAGTEYEEAKKSITELQDFNKKMNQALAKREQRWNQFRMFISLGVKMDFQYYLHKRGDEGSVKFNFKKETLDLVVKTGDKFAKGKRKDSKSLSGGEKSFSQISFLLSLWDRISSPLLCLDEFDVYMDAVNRKQSMKMLMDVAYESNSQYILITPQDASNMVPGSNVSIHRMQDPERNGQD